MRPMLVSSFDLGESYGIADSVFGEEYRRPPISSGNVGIHSPLGWGTTFRLDAGSEPVRNWREAAIEQIRRPDMADSLGWAPDQGSLAEFQDRLTEVVRGHPVERCTMTVYSVGTVYLRLQFGPGLPLPYLEGLLNCFEFAGYTTPVSDALFSAALDHANASLAREARQLRELTRRERPPSVTDADNYEESRQFTYFRHVLLCIDPGDDDLVPRLLSENDIPDTAAVLFEYHGMLHYSPGLYVLEAKGLDGAVDDESTGRNAERILADIEVAHVFEGTCDAFSRLILGEIRAQVDIYSSDVPSRADPARLNRLRTLALAVVNLTQYTLVSPTDEDQGFFARFDAEAQIDRKHQLITNAVEVLYNVQSAEQQEAASRRASRLNQAAIVLASLTVVSVMVDSYNFVREDEAIFPALLPRLVTLVLLLALILVLVRRWGRDS